MTVLEVIQRSSEFLARKGVEAPRLQIELMLAHLLQVPRLKLYLNFDRHLTEAELAQLRLLVQRRGNREPLQHILGTTCFCGLDLEVNRDVFIPRPETELLAERACAQLAALGSAPATVLDFGTGSGCLAIVLAVRCPTAQVHALDISPAALVVAERNAQRHGVQGRIAWHCGAGFAALPPDVRFDLLVSNPPYVPTAEIESLQPEVRDHDPRPALDGGADGLDYFRHLAAEGPRWVKAGGWLMCEFGDGQGPAVQELFANAGWTNLNQAPDLTGRSRILVAQRP